MTPEELLLAFRAERQITLVRDEVRRWYRVTVIRHPPPCYEENYYCFMAVDIRTGEEEGFSYRDLSAFDVPKVQVSAEFLWVEALEIDVGGGTVRSTRLLF